MPNSTEVQVGLRVPTPQWRGIVSAPASAWPGSRSLSSSGTRVPCSSEQGSLVLIGLGGAYPC